MTDHAEREVKPCPWCGSKLPPVQRETDGSKWGALSCAECSAVAPEVRTGYGPNESWYAAALNEWNNRPAEAAVLASARERVEALREKSANVVLAFHDWPGYESDHANGERKRALDDLARAITEAT